MQTEAELPVLGGSESDIQGFFTPTLHLCNEFWGQLLEQVCHKPGHEPKLAKIAIEGIVAELAALLPHPEWPGAHVLLHVLCKSLVEILHGGKGTPGGLEASREDRELLLDVAGFLVAKVCILHLQLLLQCSLVSCPAHGTQRTHVSESGVSWAATAEVVSVCHHVVGSVARSHAARQAGSTMRRWPQAPRN